jgi:hypothetical protein
MKSIKNMLMVFFLIVFLEMTFEITAQKKYINFNISQYVGFFMLFIFNYFFIFSIFLLFKIGIEYLSNKIFNIFIFIGICNFIFKGFIFFSKSYNLNSIQNYFTFLPSLIIWVIGLISTNFLFMKNKGK